MLNFEDFEDFDESIANEFGYNPLNDAGTLDYLVFLPLVLRVIVLILLIILLIALIRWLWKKGSN